MKTNRTYNIRRIIRKIFGRRMERCIIDYAVKPNRTHNNKLSTFFFTALCMPYAFISYFQKVIPYVEMDITSRCTLNCRECTHFIPEYKQKEKAADFDAELLIENIELLLPMITKCCSFRILGGEPFLHKQLYLIINKLIEESKIKHIEIVTNGTIMPNGENLNVLAHKKVNVSISDYGTLSNKKDEIIKVFAERNINTNVDQHIWFETNSLKQRGYSSEKMKSVFFSCSGAECKTLYDGKLWVCPQALHGFLLGLVKENPHEYIDLRKSTKKEFWKKLKQMYRSSIDLTTCYYCTGGCAEFVKQVPCAEQE